jgi:hypothetical protein
MRCRKPASFVGRVARKRRHRSSPPGRIFEIVQAEFVQITFAVDQPSLRDIECPALELGDPPRNRFERTEFREGGPAA